MNNTEPFEKLCIYYKDGKCKLNEEREEYQACCVCNDKYILKEGQQVEITEKYKLKRKNGKIIKM